MSGKPWTEAEKNYLRVHYRMDGARAVAEALGRTVTTVHQAAMRYGIGTPKQHLDHAEVRRLHAQGLTDYAIAARLGVSRSGIRLLRRVVLKLPVNAETVRAIKQENVRKQARTLGVRGGELRVLGFRRYARENGWPEDLRPREVQILNALARHGPLTSLQLCEAIGANPVCRGHGNRLITGMKSGGLGGTYTAALRRRGLIAYVWRSVATGRQGHGRLPGLYVLTALALRYLEEHRERLEFARGAAENAAAGSS